MSFLTVTFLSIWLVLLVGMTSCQPGNLLETSAMNSKLFTRLPQPQFQQFFLKRLEKRVMEIQTPKIFQELLSFLFSISPPHLFYLLYDSTYPEIDTMLKGTSQSSAEYTVINFTPDLVPMHSILSFDLTIVSTVRRHVLLLCSMMNIEKVFEMVSSKNLESPWLWWIVVVVEAEATKVLEGILREGSQVIVMHMVAKDSFKVLSLQFDSAGKARFSKLGSWRVTPTGYESHLSEGIFTDLEDLYSNFHGRQLTVTAVSNPPFIITKKQNNGDLLLMSGFEASIIKSLSSVLNFTYRMVTPDDGKWGGPLKNGTVVGMIGQVSRREAHFAICEITITRSRESVIDYTLPYYIESLTLVSRSSKEKNRAFAAFSPFTYKVWLCIAISVLVMGPLMVLETMIMNSYLEERPKTYNLNNSLFNMFRILLKQDNLLSSEYWPHKFTLMFWEFFCFIISVLYSGMLIASLVTPSFEKPINSLTDLPQATKDGFTLVVTADTSNHYLFRNAKEGIYKDTWQLFDHSEGSKSFPVNSDDSYDLIPKDKLVFVAGQTGAKFRAMKRGIRRYHFARDTFAPQNYGIVCFTGAPFLSLFNKLILYMEEGGLIRKWVQIEFQKVAGKSTIEQSTGPRAFTLNHLQAAFYILLLGFLTAVTALSFELLSAMACIRVHN